MLLSIERVVAFVNHSATKKIKKNTKAIALMDTVQQELHFGVINNKLFTFLKLLANFDFVTLNQK